MRKFLYAKILLPLFSILLRRRARRSDKIRQTLQGHQNAINRLTAQISGNRQESKPLAWFHVASAGEFLLALPAIHQLKSQGWQCGVTVTSVSGYNWISKPEFEPFQLLFHDYYPLDTVDNAKRLLEIIKPSAIVYVKYDLWPNLIWAADQQNIPQILMCASMHPDSGRYKSSLSRWMYRDLLIRLTGIFAITDDDATRYKEISGSKDNTVTLGNTNYEAVLLRKQGLPTPDLPPAFKEQTCLVVGSSWQTDEEEILAVIQRLMTDNANMHLVWAPHEIDESTLKRLEQAFQNFGCSRFSSMQDGARVCLVDSVGQLAGLYDYANLAYVGGGFNKTGVHNVIEPVARGVVTLFGKNISVSQDAQILVKRELAFCIEDRNAADTIISELITNTETREKLQERIKQYVNQQSGVASQIAQRICDLVEDKTH